jgi:hypothetical protein
VLGLGRDGAVLGYAVVGSAVLVSFYRPELTSLASNLLQHWRRGILPGLALGAVLALSVLRQPASGTPSGWELLWAIVWLGLVYGTFDGLLLSVAPVLAVSRGETPGLWGRPGSWRQGAIALAASLFVTAAYHLGYVEFRGLQLLQALLGNAIMTAGYLASRSATTPLLAHVIMHVAAVFHGMETTSQLPPHYPGP